MPIPSDFEHLISGAAQKYGVDPTLLYSLINRESAFNPKAVSSAGAQGLMQLMPATATELGVTDPFDPAQNVDAGTRHLARLAKQYGGDYKLALAAYNAGEGNVRKHGGIPPFKETQEYVPAVLQEWEDVTPQRARATDDEALSRNEGATGATGTSVNVEGWEDVSSDEMAGWQDVPPEGGGSEGAGAAGGGEGGGNSFQLPQSIPEAVANFKKSLPGLGEFTRGFGQRAGETALTIGELARQYVPGLNQAGEALADVAQPGVKTPESGGTLKERVARLNAAADTERTSPEAEAGASAEQMAEFFMAPGGKVKALQKLGTIPRALLTAGREAAVGGGVTALQQKEVGKDAKLAALVGGAVGGALPIIGRGTQKIAEHIGEKVIRPSGVRGAKIPKDAADYAHGAEPVSEGLLEEGVVSTGGKLYEKLSGKIRGAGESIEQILSSDPRANQPLIDGSQALKPIFEKMQSIIDNPAGTRTAKRRMLKQLREIGSSWGSQMGRQLTPRETVKALGQIDEFITDWTSTADKASKFMVKSYRKMYGSLRAQLQEVLPEIGELRGRQHHLMSARGAVARQARPQNSPSGWYVARRLGPGLVGSAAAGGGLGYAGGGDWQSAARGAIAGPALFAAGGSTLTKTAAAQLMRDAIVQRYGYRVARLLESQIPELTDEEE